MPFSPPRYEYCTFPITILGYFHMAIMWWLFLLADNDPPTDLRIHRPKLEKLASIESVKSDSVSSASESSEEDEKDKDKEDAEPTTWEIMKLCEPEKILMIVGALAAVAVGSSFPMFAILFGETYAVSKVKLLKYITDFATTN